MPITPHFVISQTDDNVQIDIHVPHVRVSPDSVQVVLTDENTCLHFASPPYLLILTFQHAFADDAEDSCAQYDPLRENGRIVLQLAKAVSGEYWEDLDLVGALVKSRTKTTLEQTLVQSSAADCWTQKSTWIKEVIDETTDENASTENIIEEEPLKEECTENLQLLSSSTNGYGFHGMFRGVFRDLARDGLAREMLEVPLDSSGNLDNPLIVLTDDDDNLQRNKSRRRQRQKMEASKFCPERYLQDLDIQDDYLYQTAMAMRPHWIQQQSQQELHTTKSDLQSTVQQLESLALDATTEETHSEPQPAEKTNHFFTAEESLQLASIPYPLLPAATNQQNQNLWLGVLDLLFAYCYDHLLTGGDPTVESPWTVSILSCSLSWLESYDVDNESVEEVVLQSIRRSLIYPYLRNLDFAVHVWKQVSYILKLGGAGCRRCIIRCLLHIRSTLDHSELYYLGNKLYVDPYLAWLQDSRRHDDGPIPTLARDIDDALSDAKSLKERIGLDLPRIEREAFDEIDGGDESASSKSESDSDESSSDDDDDDESSGDSDASETEMKANGELKLAGDLRDENFGLGIGQQHSTSLLVNNMSAFSLDDKQGVSDEAEKNTSKNPGCLIQEIS